MLIGQFESVTFEVAYTTITAETKKTVIAICVAGGRDKERKKEKNIVPRIF